MNQLRTVILAAGLGTRMKSRYAKVLHQVLGRPLIHYVLEVARKVGSLKTYVVLGHQWKEVREHLPEVVDVVLQPQLLGTADALRRCQKALSGYRGDVLALCGDTVLLRPETVRRLVRHHRRKRAACTFLTATVADAFGYGRVIRNPFGQVVSIREEKDASWEEKRIREINVGVYCFHAGLLNQNLRRIKKNRKKKEFYLTDIVTLLNDAGHAVETVQTDDASEGLGINTRKDLAVATEILRSKILQEFMSRGVTVVDPNTTFIYPDVKIGQDTVIRPFTFIENGVRIGRGCGIGPFSHLRPGTALDDGVEIGNFAEVSRSRVGKGCLMKHFSFLGDATVGAGSNIGAGVVTANYDGKNKNKTRIGRKAFIGSDSILVAPVTVGDEAITGAGSVVTKGKVIPRRAVAVGVPARVIQRKH